MIQAQQTILSATQFVGDLNKSLERGDDLQLICVRMRRLESDMVPLIAKADDFSQKGLAFNPVDSEEEVVGQTLKLMARVKLNRYGFNFLSNTAC